MQTTKIKLNNRVINYAYTENSTASGVTLLFVHAFPLDCRMWQKQLDYFEPDYRVIAPDLRGLGQSEAGADLQTPNTMELMADDLKALLDYLNLPKVVLVGLSLGGYVAFAFYRKYSSSVQALILADTKAEAESSSNKAGRYQLAEAVRSQGLYAAANSYVPKLFAARTYREQPELVETVHSWIIQNQPAGVVATLPGLAERPDSLPLLPTIQVPTLVMVGQEDVITPLAGATALAAQIPQAQFKVIANAGHLTNLEQPAAFNQAIQEFLATLQN